MTSYLGFGFPGGTELWIILAIFLLLFGHRIPGMARSMGSGIVEFKKGLKGGGDEDDDKSSKGAGGSGGKPKIEVESSAEQKAEKQPADSGTTDG